jgi:hypothetical protein
MTGVLVVASLVAGVAIALVAADGAAPSPDERFAASVCSTTLPWAEEMIEIWDDAIHTRAAPGHDAGWLKLYGLAYQGKEVARKYGAEIRALRVPDTQAGTKTAKYLEWYSRRPFETMANEERRLRKLPMDFTLLQSIRGLNNFELVLVMALSEMGDDLVLLVPELVEAFETADSCGELRELMAEGPA